MNCTNEKIRRFIREIDEQTGEVLKEYNRVVYDDGLVVVKGEKGFTKVHGIELMKYAEKLTATDALIMLCLINNVAYETCMLTKTGNNDKRYLLTHNDIEAITGVCRRSVSISMGNLVSVGLLARVKYKNSYIYYANPFVFLKGNSVSKAILDIFK